MTLEKMQELLRSKGGGPIADSLTLVDWFAGQALNGGLSNGMYEGLSPEQIAKVCYNTAEAFLEERQKRGIKT